MCSSCSDQQCRSSLAGVRHRSGLRVDGSARQRLAQPGSGSRGEHCTCYWAAGADLPKSISLLEQLYVDAPLPGCRRGGDPTDAATGDQDPEITPPYGFLGFIASI